MLYELIEAARREMYETAMKTGFTSEDTIRASQKLDALLNQLQEMKDRENQ